MRYKKNLDVSFDGEAFDENFSFFDAGKLHLPTCRETRCAVNCSLGKFMTLKFIGRGSVFFKQKQAFFLIKLSEILCSKYKNIILRAKRTWAKLYLGTIEYGNL